ncbi:MAG: GtrA family protein [Steroidobacteraceae bacterium]|jgi:putative flippase GtrA
MANIAISDKKPSVLGVARQMLSFSVVGVLGFLVDAGVLYIALSWGLGLYAGRAVSYMSAVSATWLLNRRYTFARTFGDNKLHEWARFVVSQLSGATINLGMYALLVHMSPLVAREPVIGVAAGSLSGLLVNFWVARVFVFDK